jgi:type VI secretion system secreted protein VgrG
VELGNGEKFDLKAWEKFDPKDKALHNEQVLSNQGARAFDDSTDGRIHS